MATTFASEERELKMKLPLASEAKPLTSRPRALVINIDQQGRYFESGGEISLGKLQERLDAQAAAAKDAGGASVILRADEGCRWKDVVAAMNACVRAGIADYRVMTRQGPN
jgi:biopolymer transport protein ExbD